MTTTAKKTQSATQKIVFCGVFSAIAFALYLLEFPIIPSLNYLKLDFSEIPALIGAIFFGPIYGVIIEFLKNLIELLVKGMGTQLGFGNLMNFVVGCAYIIPFSIIYNKFLSPKEVESNESSFKTFKKKNIFKAIVIASIVSIICIILVGIAGNYVIAPLFFKHFMHINLSSKALWGAIWGATAMNAIKGSMLSILIYPFIKLFSKVKVR